MESIASKVDELARNHFGEYRVFNGQVIPKYCPLCGGGEHKDRDTFAIGLWNGLWNCKRGNCVGINGKQEGNLKQLCDRFGESSFEFAKLPMVLTTAQKTYDMPNPDDLQELTDKIITYFARRGISEKTLRDFGISSNKDGNIVFPFYQDGKLVFVKYRKPEVYKGDGKKDKKEWMMPNTKPILFNMDNVSFNKPLVITEGQCDAMALYEAGVSNVVSVPMGASNLEWITLCYDWLDKFNQIILFGDSDDPGQKMVSNVMVRLGEYRCCVPKTYPPFIYKGKDRNRPCKDANEILLAYGPESLKEIVDACEPAPLKGVLDVSTINYVDPATVPRILTNIPALNNMIGGFEEAGVTILSGRRGEGKSTISSNFLLSAIEQGHKCCAYSGELSAQRFLEWIMLPATETHYVSYCTDARSGKVIPRVPNDIQERIKDWLAGKLYLFDNGYVFEEDSATSVIKCFEMCVRRYGCDLFLIDNLMMLLTTSDEENKAQARFMARVKAFAAKYKVHVLVVAHPRKEKPDSTFTSDSVSGSSVITNLADNVFSIEKPNIRVVKNRSFGETGFILCDYNPVNRRIYQKNLGDTKIYPWDHTGIKEPEDRAMDLEEFQIQSGSEPQEPPF